jgi:3-oxoacid CoA-transferase subunit B
MSGLSRELIALRAARELKNGQYVNLGIGLPTLVSNFVTEEMGIVLHSENGALGFGHIADEDEMDIDFVNASSQPLTMRPGAAFFDSAEAFAMIRSGRIDVTVLGAYQVSEKGDLANWMAPGRKAGSIGGSMDLVSGTRRVIVVMEHTTRYGTLKVLTECTCPLTGHGVVDTIITNLAVIKVTPEGLLLKETAPSVSAEDVQVVTEPELLLADDLREMDL